ncbi:hypothetical protein B0T14DRAFT_604145 [Immersiella caudata]|uniref:MYND-type domain-containing protein n=1 Tax=Immersiella caudata TaxID=314043 RepID=A0AA39WS41_9PEZI|nr:hypothetical protein B0T14DRAFT_604145 [Immersiella caudata]
MSNDTIKLVDVTTNPRRAYMMEHVPSLRTDEEKRCCRCGDPNPVFTCDQCRAIWYCSQACANYRASIHKKLCYKYRHTKPNQEDKNIHAAYFPWDGPKPFITFVGANTWPADIESQRLVERTRNNPDIGCITIDKNELTGRKLPFTLKIVYRHWEGGLVVVRCGKGPNSNIAQRITMADFQDVIDFFAFFGNQFIDPQMRPYLPLWPLRPPLLPSGGAIIHCDAILTMTQDLLDPVWDMFSIQLVDSLDPIRGHIMPPMGDISDLSRRCGMELRLLRIARPSVYTGVSEWHHIHPDPLISQQRANRRAHYLMNAFGLTHPSYDGNEVNDVLAIRTDGKDLTHVEMVAMYHVAWDVAHGVGQATPQAFAQALNTWQSKYDSHLPKISEAARLSSRSRTLPRLEQQLL